MELVLLLSWIVAPVRAGEVVEGNQLRIHYGELGSWNDPEADAGFQVRFVDEWVEISNAGAPYHLLAVAAVQSGATVEGFVSGFDQTATLDLIDADWARPDGRVGARFRHRIGDLEIERVEEWTPDARMLSVSLTLHNMGSEPFSDARILYAYESDPENNPPTMQDQSANDVVDLDGDGVLDWVESAGLDLGFSTGIGTCGAQDVELGHFGEWGGVSQADEPLVDADGATEDWAMGIRIHFAPDLEPGEELETTFLISAGATPEEARDNYLAGLALCSAGQDTAGKEPEAGCGGCSTANRGTGSWVWAALLSLVTISHRRRSSGRGNPAHPFRGGTKERTT